MLHHAQHQLRIEGVSERSAWQEEEHSPFVAKHQEASAEAEKHSMRADALLPGSSSSAIGNCSGYGKHPEGRSMTFGAVMYSKRGA